MGINDLIRGYISLYFFPSRGHRVAYSVFGTVTSLSGDAEVGVVVEAVGVGGEHPDCSQLQEESTSETNGVFRIRGLQPQVISILARIILNHIGYHIFLIR